jgi:hypothetical protein
MTDADTWRNTRPAQPAARSCGACEMCCTIMAVRELEKSPWSPCPLLAGGGGGCGVWGSHPASCKSFTCLWLTSDVLLPLDMFPAECGFLLALDPAKTWPTVVKVCAEASRPDAWDTPRNREIFARLAAAWNCPVAVVHEGVRASHVFAPRGGVYSRAERPDIFPNDGGGLALTLDDYDPDRRPPVQRIAEATFSWDWDQRNRIV